VASAPPERPYGSSSVVGAILLTLFAPFISLIVALLLRGSQQDPARKRQLGTWAAASAAYLLAYVILAVALFASIASGTSTDTSGPCVGGPQMGASGEPLGDGRYRFPCEISGSTIVRLP
jgi:hypothetical protein